jgi:hypothetical protein
MPPSGTCRSDGIAECSSHQLSVRLIPVNFSARMSQLGHLPSSGGMPENDRFRGKTDA